MRKDECAYDATDPMELGMTKRQRAALLSDNRGSSYLLFPEDREFPIRRRDILPKRWLKPCTIFRGQARRGEWYTFQIGVYAARTALKDIRVSFSRLKSEQGDVIPAAAFNCINLGGIDWKGRPFTKNVSVPKGEVQPLWIGVQIPKAANGLYRGRVTVGPAGEKPRTIDLFLEVGGEVLDDCGDDEMWRHSRLRWLDSTVGLADEPIAPFTPLRVRGNSVSCLGRTVRLGANGLPESIVSRFSRSVTRLEKTGRELLNRPMAFIVDTAAGPVKWSGAKMRFTHRSRGSVEWESASHGGALSLHCKGRMEFDGYVRINLTLKARKTVTLDNVRLEVPFRREAAAYLMGMGRPGGLRREALDWKWDRAKHQDSVWVGDVNVGLRCHLYGRNYRRPLCNAHYKHGPLNLPESWHNRGRGGCTVEDADEKTALLNAYSGKRTIRAGEAVFFGADFYVTPFKTIDTDAHWSRRYFHGPVSPPAEVADKGANTINIHQSYAQNPFINYPFLPEPVRELTEYTGEAHRGGLQVKLYYTVRELTTRTIELWALRALGQEVLLGGDGRGYFARTKKALGNYAWCRKHLRTDYTVAWRQPLGGKYEGEVDESILTTGMSRWHNYYLEGLAWLCGNAQIDGLYIDDVAYDRVVMQRVRRIFDELRPGHAGIDVHSWNHLNPHAGWANCANLYMEHFPYLERIWFGEGFDCNGTTPDYWLVEMSGIPFGLLGEMLERPNPWRGMVFGATVRLPWSGDPRNVWKVWDEFGMAGTEMLGWWDEACPVKTYNPAVLATVYCKTGRALVALASWAAGPVDVKLAIDWAALGMGPDDARITAPEVPEFQEADAVGPSDTICIEPGKGRLLVISTK